MSYLKILDNKLCYGKKKIQAYTTLRASYTSHLGRSDDSFLFLNCAQSLVLGEEAVCNFAVAAGKLGACVLLGVSGFLGSCLGACLVSRGALKYWFAKTLVCCACVVFHPRLGSPLQAGFRDEGMWVHVALPMLSGSAPCYGHVWAIFRSQWVKFRGFGWFCFRLHASPGVVYGGQGAQWAPQHHLLLKNQTGMSYSFCFCFLFLPGPSCPH